MLDSTLRIAARRVGGLIVVLGLLLVPFAVRDYVAAQDATPDGGDAPVECLLELPASALDSTAFAFRVDVTTTSDAGQFATISLCAQTADGWVKLTACDNAATLCAPLTLRMEDAVQGETLIAVIEAP